MKLVELHETNNEPKKYCLVGINIDYENSNGHDVNTDFVIAVQCKDEAEAQALHDDLAKRSKNHNLQLSDEAGYLHADDIVNGPTWSHSVYPDKGPSSKVPKNAYLVQKHLFLVDIL